MDNLINPQLQRMSMEDLNQRYSDSWVLYRDVPTNVIHFAKDDDGKMTIQALAFPNEKGANVSEVFAWDRLNVARPRAGWYISTAKGKPVAFHFSYPIKRQWKRGLNSKNCHFSLPTQTVVPTNNAYSTVLRDQVDIRRYFEDNALEAGVPVVLRGDRLLLPPVEGDEKPVWKLYFRTLPIASFDLKEHKLLLHIQGMEQEVSEVCRSRLVNGLKTEFAPIESPKRKSMFVAGEIDAMIDRMVQDHQDNANVIPPGARGFREDPLGTRDFADGHGRWVYDTKEELERCFHDMIAPAAAIDHLRREGRYNPQRRKWKLTHIDWQDFEHGDRTFDTSHEVWVEFVNLGMYRAYEQTYRVVHQDRLQFDNVPEPWDCSLYIIREEVAPGENQWHTKIIIRRGE